MVAPTYLTADNSLTPAFKGVSQAPVSQVALERADSCWAKAEPVLELQLTLGIKPHSEPNLAVAKQSSNVSSADGCTRIKSLWSGCTRPGAELQSNLPPSCIMTVEGLGPKGLQKKRKKNREDSILDSQTNSFRPDLVFEPKTNQDDFEHAIRKYTT